MYGEQLRSVTPCASQAPRNRTASTPTKFTSSKSSTIFDSLSLTCFSSSAKCSACIRPMSRIFVLAPSEYLSIFKVIFDLSGVSRLNELQYQRHSQSIELLVFSLQSQAGILAFAEYS